MDYLDQIKKQSQLVSPKGKKLKVYQLFLEKANCKTAEFLQKYTLGKPGLLNSQEKVLMVLGATGSGKSTLVNGMVNYLLGVKWCDDFRFRLIANESSKNQAYSQTSLITAYTIYPFKNSQFPYTFTIVDTPGFGNTNGTEVDKTTVKLLHAFFSVQDENGIDHLDGIGFVVQACLPRLTQTQRYIFNSILSIFGKDLAKNIFMMITFADGQNPPVMTAIQEAGIPSSTFFKFNNCALFTENTLPIHYSNEDYIDDTLMYDKMFWEMGLVSFKNFLKVFSHAQPINLCLTREVLLEIKQLETAIHRFQQQIDTGVSKLEEFQKEEQVLQLQEANIASNKDYTYTVEITKQRKVQLPPDKYVTNCVKCNYTCHKDCTISHNSEMKSCSVMENQGESSAKCKVCPNKCAWNCHISQPYYFEIYKETEIKILEHMKGQYTYALEEKAKIEDTMINLDHQLCRIKSQMTSTVQHIHMALQRLNRIALKPNLLNLIERINNFVESEKQHANPGFQQRIRFYEQAKKEAEVLKLSSDFLSYAQDSTSKMEDERKKPWYRFWQKK